MRRTLLTAMLYAAHALAPAPQVSVIDAAAKVVQAGVAAAPTGKPVRRIGQLRMGGAGWPIFVSDRPQSSKFARFRLRRVTFPSTRLG